MAASLRQRKKAKARRDLERTALRLFAKKGYAATSVDEIAAAVELSPRTFFRYFSSKEDVVFASADEELEALVEALNAVPEGLSPYRTLEAAAVGFAGDLESRQDDMRVRFRLIKQNPTLRNKAREKAAEWAGTVSACLAAREGRDEATQVDEQLALLVISALWSALEAWGDNPEGDMVSDVLTALLESCRAALV